ncbi:MAG: c-type cytochrome [Planctomycetes bacterium]|nr:c-type cytochrome [Planctomycetota bacterium]MCH9723982.1 c-type cytochrome [Planctomycetota bacterium]MCH9774867.1 c-type cytochrome [Planctomycetota bacterium]MCH9793396.1 c-type cytochrome [Planctomycetota bacterium]
MNLQRMALMIFFVAITLNCAFVRAAEPVSAPVPVKEAAQRMSLPNGFQVSLFAGEPAVVQPIAMTFDARGRLWVVECLSYPGWKKDNTGHDRVTILEDTNGDGQHDKRTVFLENGVNLTGIEVGFGGVWLTATPNLIFVPDRNNDDRPDGPPEVVLDGWDLTARHNVFNSLIWGPDGWLYGCNGILSHSRIGAPGTPDDQRTPMDCGVWRYHPTRKTFNVVASGSTNPWGLDFDEFGQAFITNCVIKHLFHIIPGAHYERMFGQDINPYSYTLIPSCADHIHWGGGDWTTSRTGKVHDDAGGGHAHSGCAIYLGDNFPAEYRNNVFMCNIHGNRLNRDILEREGPGFEAHHARDFLHANDPWFRGISVKCGPEGGLYFSDWTDTGECHNYEVADKSNGRIYRVTYGDVKTSPRNLGALSNTELVQLQFDKNEWKVRTARRLLQERAADSKMIAPTTDLIIKLDPQNEREAVRKLWALYAVGGMAAVQKSGMVKNNASEWVRFWAIQLAADEAGPWSPALKTEIAAQLKGSTPLIRRSLASTCQQRIRSGHLDEVQEILKALLSNVDDRNDPLLQALNWYALEPVVASHSELVLEWIPEIKMPLVQTFVARRMVGLEGGFESLAAVWKNSSNAEWHTASLKGVLNAYAGVIKLPMPVSWPATYARLQKHTDPNVRYDAKVLGTIFGDAKVVEEFRAVMNDQSQPPKKRMDALNILLTRKAEQLDKTLRSLLDDTDFRTAAIRGLVSVGGKDVPELLLVRYSKVTPAQRQEIIQGLTTRANYAHTLVNAIEKGSVPRTDVSALIIRQMQAINDKKLSSRLKTVWGEIRPISERKQELIKQYRAELTPATLASADMNAGKKLYKKTCATCHKLFGEGQEIGPEITGSQRTSLDYLLDNILDPSAIVPSNYRVVILVLEDGRILQGIVSEENNLHLTLKTATEKLIIPLSSIEARKTSGVSMMPEGMLDKLTPAERRDLIAYLQSPAGVMKSTSYKASDAKGPGIK